MKSAAFRAAALALVVSLAGCKKEKEETDATKVPGFDVSSLDSTSKACDDFDAYANGGWKKKNPIPGTARSSTLSRISSRTG